MKIKIKGRRPEKILERLTEGNGEQDDIEKLDKLSHTIKNASVCGLGQTAPNPVLSTLKYFRDEYIAHVEEQKCPAGECKALANITIIEEKCKGCGLCKRNCPVGAISGEIKTPHKIDPEVCIKCGACVDKCPFKAILK